MTVQSALRQAFGEVASPAYVFSAQAFAARAKMVKEAFGEDTDICYSIKANPFLLAVLPEEFSKIEVCSPGELEICRALHIDPAKIIFSGVNKSQAEVNTAVDYGVRILTAESENHLRYISKAASERGITAEVLVRLSCESQFGMDKSDVFRVIADRASYPGTDIKGIHYFTGTQKTRPKEIIKEIARLNKLIDRLEEELGFTTEVTLHHMMFAADDVLGTEFKVNPPIRDVRTRDALCRTVEAGRITMFGSDHAPHTQNEKAQEYATAPGGMVGVETTIPILMNWVMKGKFPLALLEKMGARNPAVTFGLNKGRIKVGMDADLVLFDTKKTSTINADMLHSKSGHTAYAGMEAIFPDTVIVRGNIQIQDSEYCGGAIGVDTSEHARD